MQILIFVNQNLIIAWNQKINYLKIPPDYEDDDRKIIIRYIGNEEFEKLTSHEKMTLTTYDYKDSIYKKFKQLIIAIKDWIISYIIILKQ